MVPCGSGIVDDVAAVLRATVEEVMDAAVVAERAIAEKNAADAAMVKKAMDGAAVAKRTATNKKAADAAVAKKATGDVVAVDRATMKVATQSEAESSPASVV
jgi:hypothetical protein